MLKGEFEGVFEVMKVFVNAALVFAEAFFRHFKLLDVRVIDGRKEKVVANGASKDADSADVTVNGFGKSGIVRIIETSGMIPFGEVFKLYIVNKPGGVGGESFKPGFMELYFTVDFLSAGFDDVFVDEGAECFSVVFILKSIMNAERDTALAFSFFDVAHFFLWQNY